MNKKTSTLLMLTLTVSLAACDGETPGVLETNEILPETRIQGLGVTGVLPSTFAPVQLDVTATQEFEEGNIDFLNSIQIKEITLEISANSEGASDTLEDGMPDDFSFMSEIAVNIVATIGGERKSALIGGLLMNDPKFAPENRRLELDLTRTNILPFVEAIGGYSVEVSAQGTPPPDDVVFGGNIVYRVGFATR